MTEETEIVHEETDFSLSDAWLDVMDLEIGKEVMLIPVGGNGSGFQGTLIDLISNEYGPAIFVIENAVKQRVSVNWENCVMATKVVGPSGAEVGPEEMLKIADEAGIEVPENVREAIANLEN